MSLIREQLDAIEERANEDGSKISWFTPEETTGLINMACECLDLREQLATMRAERDAARHVARCLAHAYEHDSQPMPHVVEEALNYPVAPKGA